jgi:DNA-binding LacI/PurR family transcriptional regulator
LLRTLSGQAEFGFGAGRHDDFAAKRFAAELPPLRGAWEAGLQVPGDLSVIGADNISLCDYTCPSLTTIAQPVGDIGTQAVQMLFERIDRKTKAAPRKKVLSSKLVIRESAGKAPRN